MSEEPETGPGDTVATARTRALDRALTPLREALQVVVVLVAVAQALDIFRRWFGLVLYGEQLLAAALGAGLAIVFLRRATASRPGALVPRLVYLGAAALMAGAAGYIALDYPRLAMIATMLPRDAVIAGSILVLGLLWALRLAAGIGLVAVVVVFVLYGLFGHLAPGDFRSRYNGPEDLAVYLAIDASGMLGIALQVAVIVVVPYILFGQLLARLGAADFFNDAAMTVMGAFRGGTAKVAIAASSLFGTISGTAVGNVVGTGVVTIPMMKKSGVTPRHAAAIEAVASTGGQLVPPVMGAAAFIMADFMRVSYAEVMIAAFLPGLLYYIALFIHVDLLAAKTGIRPVDRKLIPPGRQTLARGWHFLPPFFVLFYTLFAMNMRPEMAAMYAAGVLLVGHYLFAGRGRRATPRELLRVIVGAGGAATELVLVCAGAGIIIGVLNLTGLAFNLTMHIVSASAGSLLLLALITAAISIVLGMGMPTVGVYILLATLVVPALVQAGVSLMAAHLFVFYFGLMSMITPPVALAAFAGANIAGANAWQTSLTAIRLGWTAYVVPFMFLFAPALLLQGDALTVSWAVITAIAGIWMTTVAIVGFSRARLGGVWRVVLAVSGLSLLAPAELFAAGWVLGVIGAAGFVAFILQERRTRREIVPPAPAVAEGNGTGNDRGAA